MNADLTTSDFSLICIATAVVLTLAVITWLCFEKALHARKQRRWDESTHVDWDAEHRALLAEEEDRR